MSLDTLGNWHHLFLLNLLGIIHWKEAEACALQAFLVEQSLNCCTLQPINPISSAITLLKLANSNLVPILCVNWEKNEYMFNWSKFALSLCINYKLCIQFLYCNLINFSSYIFRFLKFQLWPLLIQILLLISCYA